MTWVHTKQVTCVDAWHGPEDEPWTMAALRDVQKDTVLDRDFVENKYTLPCYVNQNYEYVMPKTKSPSNPKPFISRFTLIPQSLHCHGNLARIDLWIEKRKYLERVVDELDELLEVNGIEQYRTNFFPESIYGGQFWIRISLPKPQVEEIDHQVKVVDDSRTKQSTALVLNMIHRLQGLNFYKDKSSSESLRPLYPHLNHKYKFDKVTTVQELAQTMLQNVRANIRSRGDLQDIHYIRSLLTSP